MPYTTLISTQDLAAHLDDPDWAIVDCRFALTAPEQGRKEYQQSHIAGAVYAHLDNDLSGPIIPGKTGRHPLPEVETFVQTLGKWGIDNKTQVVAYDAIGGAFAVRVWWLLYWLGYKSVAVLDGGWPRWQKEGHPVRSGVESREPRTFTPPQLRPELVVEVDEVLKLRTDPNYHLFDSRNADRYRGENETIDPVAGHIPGAVCLPFANNTGSDGMFLSPEVLKARFQEQLGDIPVERAVFYCGSGVTAAHNILAMVYAGLGEAKLYAGSWSEWITDPERPVATGTT